MNPIDKKEGKQQSRYSLTLALAGVAGQVGCVTLVIVVSALFIGLWLDRQFNTSPIFLATLLIGSVPITVIIMLWIVRSVTARMKPSTKVENIDSQEVTDRGRNT